MRILNFFCILLSLPFLSSFQFLANAASCRNILSSSALGDFHADDTLLRVLVPWKVGFDEFIRFDNTSCTLDGFSIQIFQRALINMGSRAPQFQLFLHGDGKETPLYNDMVEMVYNGIADAIVADLTITKERMDKVGFTIPYIPTKLVMVTPLIRYKSERNIWTFLKPLSIELWVAIFVFFIVTGYTLYIMEYKNLDFDSTNSTNENETSFHFFDKSRIMNAYWFTSLCVIATQRESVRTHLGRFVTLLWLLAFSKSHSSMINDVSKEIVSLSENKTIKQLQSFWTIGGVEYMDQCSPSPLGLRSFAGLFAIVACVYIVCIVGRLLTLLINALKS